MHNKKKRIFIIAGEVSGDILASHIMRQMPNTEFIGIGGAEMRAMGLKSIFPMSDLSVMGVMEVVAHLRTLTRRIKQTIEKIIETHPDMVLTVDSPGFARSVIKGLRKTNAGRAMIEKGLRFHHVVAPQVWAWRPKRAKKYAKAFDKLYAFFDFEIPYFTKYGLDTMAVGHPIAETLLKKGVHGPKLNKTTTDEKIITLVPGSRMSEVRRLMPIFETVVQTINSCGYTGYRFAIPTVETTAEYVREQIKSWSIIPELVDGNNRYELYRKTYVAIVASGTISVELAMLHIPAIVTYKMNPITTWLVRRVIRVKWVSLVNILRNKTIYPECLGTDANSDAIINALDSVVLPATRTRIISELKSADKMWMRIEGPASRIIANDIIHTLS